MTQYHPHEEHVTSFVNCLAASFESPERANTATDALLQEGFAPEDLHLVHPEEVDAFRAPHVNMFRRLLMVLEDAATTQVAKRSSFVHLLEQGESILVVYCPRHERLEAAHQIVRQHGGLNITHFGRWTTDHLPS